MTDFRKFISTIRPPADGRYLWKVVSINPSTFALSLTAVAVGGEYDGRRFSTQLRVEQHADKIESLMGAIDGYNVEHERDLHGRTFYGTKRTSKRGTSYLTEISVEEDYGLDSSAEGARDDESASDEDDDSAAE